MTESAETLEHQVTCETDVVEAYPPAWAVKGFEFIAKLKATPHLYPPVGTRLLVPCESKIASIYRWLRIGPPKTGRQMSYSLKTPAARVRYLMDDLRRMGVKITAVKTRRGRAYQIDQGPYTYARLKQQLKTQC